MARCWSPAKLPATREGVGKGCSHSQEERNGTLKRRSRVGLLAFVAVLAVIAVGVGVWVFVLNDGDDSDDDPIVAAGGTLTALASTPAPTITAAATQTAAAPAADVAATAQAAGCLITPPIDRRPGGWSGQIEGFPTWYGDPDAGVWVAPPSVAGFDPTLTDEPGDWFTGGLLVTIWAQGRRVELTGEPSDGRSGALEFDVQGSSRESGVTALLTIPEPGCWDLELTVDEQTVPLVVYVFDQTERADFATGIERRETLLANLYPIPNTCAVTEPVLADRQLDLYAALYWYDGEDLAAYVWPPGLFWAGEEARMTWYPGTQSSGDALRVNGHLVEDPGTILHSTVEHQTGTAGDRWVSRLVFPEPGCWEISGSTAGGALDATVYVFPFDCRHEPGELVPAACRAPGT